MFRPSTTIMLGCPKVLTPQLPPPGPSLLPPCAGDAMSADPLDVAAPAELVPALYTCRKKTSLINGAGSNGAGIAYSTSR